MFLNATLLTSFRKLFAGKTYRFACRFCDSSSGRANAKKLLETLYQKNTVDDVRAVYNCLSEVYPVAVANIEKEVV